MVWWSFGKSYGVPRLRRVDCSEPGYRRRRAGRGFVYVDASGNRVRDEETLARVRALAIPPAWADVWICSDARGHVQATGTDARGRRQYRYHDVWRQHRDREKFDHMLEFARTLPKIRRRCARDLAGEDLLRDRVLACAVRLLDLGFFRIGTEGYAEENQTYGLATIEKRHVSIAGDVITFDYAAKNGKRRIQSVVDADVLPVIQGLKRRRGGGPELLAFRSSTRWIDVRSNDINDYIRDMTGSDFTAKDFRTWNATVLASVALAVSAHASTPTARKRAITRAIKEVALYLGNTPAVCRSSYVDPRVIDRYRVGHTITGALERLGDGVEFGQLSTQGAIERAVMELLEEETDAPALKQAA
jgi:DNA topoisomerase-1